MKFVQNGCLIRQNKLLLIKSFLIISHLRLVGQLGYSLFGVLILRRVPTISHIYSIGNRSGELERHGSRVTFFSCKNFLATLGIRERVLFCK